ncbi:hypothetical protein F5Y07DRAFT_285989 [Xylaria sp. FL0933]|nr:hypothetical protein F5Y07DRAFT_285989 [Xylaria sp. FL0933]
MQDHDLSRKPIHSQGIEEWLEKVTDQGCDSSTKREAAMRIADDLPLERVSLEEFLNSPSVGRATASLVKDLATMRQKTGILPAALKSLIQSQESINDHLDDTMFTSTTSAISAAELEFQHRRLVRICQSSAECNDPARPVYEAEWNNKVHAPILELALDADLALDGSSSRKSLVFHNISDARVAFSFRDPSALLQDSMVDYGIFLAPTRTSPLGALITSVAKRLMQFNALENFEIDRPLAVAIETKQTRGGDDANAPSQLANFARAQSRVTRYLFSGTKAPVGVGSIILPLIEVTGQSWRISFAVLDADRVLVSSDLDMGSTKQMSDCYVLLQSLLRLLRWLRTECAACWTAHLQISKT